jgi:hypothetical protein
VPNNAFVKSAENYRPTDDPDEDHFLASVEAEHGDDHMVSGMNVDDDANDDYKERTDEDGDEESI